MTNPAVLSVEAIIAASETDIASGDFESPFHVTDNGSDTHRFEIIPDDLWSAYQAYAALLSKFTVVMNRQQTNDNFYPGWENPFDNGSYDDDVARSKLRILLSKKLKVISAHVFGRIRQTYNIPEASSLESCMRWINGECRYGVEWRIT